MCLPDTRVVSELRKVGDGRADSRVTAWISRQDAASFYISALTLVEREIGVLRIERLDCRQRAHPPLNHCLKIDENVRRTTPFTFAPA